MVGLPARGKTYISKKLTRYLNWIGVPTRGEAPRGSWWGELLREGKREAWVVVRSQGRVLGRGW